MSNTERNRLKFLRRMALSHLIYCQGIEKERKLNPYQQTGTIADYDLQNEFKAIEEVLSETKLKLSQYEN